MMDEEMMMRKCMFRIDFFFKDTFIGFRLQDIRISGLQDKGLQIAVTKDENLLSEGKNLPI